MIERGDLVTLYYVGLKPVPAEVIHTPGGPGDSWYVRYLESDREALINVYQHDFVNMILDTKYRDREDTDCPF